MKKMNNIKKKLFLSFFILYEFFVQCQLVSHNGHNMQEVPHKRVSSGLDLLGNKCNGIILSP